MENLANLIVAVVGVLELVALIYIVKTCRNVNEYISLKEEEAYQKAIYEKAKQDIREINSQLEDKS